MFMMRSHGGMIDHPAGWRMPTRKQIERLASAAPVGRNAPGSPAIGRGDDMPPEYWRAVLDDVSADARPTPDPIGTQRLCDIDRHLLRVGCRRCGRTVELQKVEAIRLYGPDSIWRNVGQRLLDNTCSQRTGRHEEDGCGPACDVP
ncbi:hypothetical protein AB7008_41160 [Bradyrhizobium sp. 521_C7_N1_3]|uniref:hypothetical protein n=1 Tax=Bradyrhizobium sp. 521_C7_N1_3 TaxID=3240368 RepID=UPI003F8A871F